MTEESKRDFKSALFNIIGTKSNDYLSLISDEAHLKNIQSVSDFSNEYGDILTIGKLNFGVSQKLLNLYLKYLWC